MSKLLSEGGFGCLYYPGLKCSGASGKSLKRTTKLQRDNGSSDNEYHISNIIKTIPNYKFFFSPVLDVCPVSIVKIKKSLLDKCNVVKDDKSDKSIKHVLMGLEYVKNTPFETIISSSSSKDIIKIILENFAYLLNSISLLVEKKIVHYDLKLQNILFEKATKTPIIIDFGISMKIDEIDMDNLKEYFYVFAPDYYLWPLEAHLLSYYASKKMVHITSADVDLITKRIVGENYALYFFDEESVRVYEAETNKYLTQFIGLEPELAVIQLIKSYKTWDLFALSILYLDIMQMLFESGFNDNKILGSFYNLLWQNIQPNPANRLGLPQTITKFNDLLYNKYEAVYSELIDTLAFSSDTVTNKIKFTNKKLSDIMPDAPLPPVPLLPGQAKSLQLPKY